MANTESSNIKDTFEKIEFHETCQSRTSFGLGHAKTCLMSYANNKGADQSLNLTWSKISEDTFSRDVAHLIYQINVE